MAAIRASGPPASSAASIAAIVVFFVFSTYVSLRGLEKENEGLRKALVQSTQRIFGEKISEPQKALRKLREGLTEKGGSIPEVSAADLLRRISKQVPEPGEVKLDVKRLDIELIVKLIGTHSAAGTQINHHGIDITLVDLKYGLVFIV